MRQICSQQLLLGNVECKTLGKVEVIMANMCRKCNTSFHKHHVSKCGYGAHAKEKFCIGHYVCPECFQVNLWLDDEHIYPLQQKHKLAPVEVRNQNSSLADSYEEAGLLLDLSPNASAALSRRCLQIILREKAGVNHSDLFREIGQVTNSGNLQTDLSNQLDNIRHLGNFAAHPNKDAAGFIIDVKMEEAQYSLEVVGELFEFYYLRPVRIAAATAQINQKVSSKTQ